MSLQVRADRVAGDVLLTAAPIVSDYTRGEWAQFLPDRNSQAVPRALGTEPIWPGGLPTRPLQASKINDNTVELSPAPRLIAAAAAHGEPGQGFVHRLLLTRTVLDAGGHPSPVYIGILRSSVDVSNRFEVVEAPVPLSLTGRLQARVVLVQLNRRPGNGYQELNALKSLFPDDVADPTDPHSLDDSPDAPARLIVVSDPFDIELQA